MDDTWQIYWLVGGQESANLTLFGVFFFFLMPCGCCFCLIECDLLNSLPWSVECNKQINDMINLNDDNAAKVVLCD